MSVTFAPRRHAAAASATPMRPLLRFERTRTGSTSSRVGPAVTTTLRPANDASSSSRATCATIVSGSGMRPSPLPSPAASAPSSGSSTV